MNSGTVQFEYVFRFFTKIEEGILLFWFTFTRHTCNTYSHVIGGVHGSPLPKGLVLSNVVNV